MLTFLDDLADKDFGHTRNDHRYMLRDRLRKHVVDQLLKGGRVARKLTALHFISPGTADVSLRSSRTYLADACLVQSSSSGSHVTVQLFLVHRHRQ